MANLFSKLFGKKEQSLPIISEVTIEHRSVENERAITESLPEAILQEAQEIETVTKVDEIAPEKEVEDLVIQQYEYPNVQLFHEPVWNYFGSLRDAACQLPIFWSVEGEKAIIKDLAELKNIFITGTQATGKTMFLHQLIISLLMKKHPIQLQLVLADAKMVEFAGYRNIEKHFLTKLPGSESAVIENKTSLLNTISAIKLEIANRYDLFAAAGVRDSKAYNAKFVARQLDPLRGHQFLCDIILIIDDLGAFSNNGEPSVMEPLTSILIDGYKVGIFTIIGTSQGGTHATPNSLLNQISSRVVFRLNSKEEYKRFFETIRIQIPFSAGDFLYNELGCIHQGSTIPFSYEDITNLTDFIGNQQGNSQAYLLPTYIDANDLTGIDFDLNEKDSLFEDAARLIVSSQSGSTALLQRRMKLGYNRAGRLMDHLEAAGIVGPNQGSKVREVLIKTEAELQQYLDNL